MAKAPGKMRGYIPARNPSLQAPGLASTVRGGFKSTRMGAASLDERIAQHEKDLFARYQSPIVGTVRLRAFLGFQSARAFRIAARCERLPVPTFFLPGRRGRFARIKDLATWLAQIDMAASDQEAPR